MLQSALPGGLFYVEMCNIMVYNLYIGFYKTVYRHVVLTRKFNFGGIKHYGENVVNVSLCVSNT